MDLSSVTMATWLLGMWIAAAAVGTFIGVVMYGGSLLMGIDDEDDLRFSAGFVLGGIFLPFVIIGLFILLMYRAFRLYFPKGEFPVR